jgi:hypothetical protein
MRHENLPLHQFNTGIKNFLSCFGSIENFFLKSHAQKTYQLKSDGKWSFDFHYCVQKFLGYNFLCEPFENQP